MKKTFIIALATLSLVACSEKEQYEKTVHELIANDPDVKSYHLDVDTMTECVIDLSTKNMDGILPFEPARKLAYIGYTKMISLKKAEDPEAVLKELHESFGSAQGLAKAHLNYSESYLECIATVTNRDLDAKEELLKEGK